jgi:hypothetical protein
VQPISDVVPTVFDGRTQEEPCTMGRECDDEAIAAVLTVALEHGGVPFQDVIARIDLALLERDEATPWLAAASLAPSKDDLLAVLSGVPASHAIRGDPFAVFEVLALVRERGTLSTRRAVAFILSCYYDRTLPVDLDALAADVYEDGFCAHAYDDVQPELADRAVGAFLVAARSRSAVSGLIARICQDGWV